MLEGKTLIITGCASGIGWETARLAKRLGARVIGVDRTMTHDHVDEMYRADLSDPHMVRELIQALPHGAHCLANIAGLPPTAPAALVLKVNLVGLKALTLGLIPKLADGASIVNLASLAGFGWADHVSSILESERLHFDGVDEFVRTHDAGDAGGRSYFFSKEALVAWTLENRWTWRERGIRMNAVSPGPVDTPILPDFVQTLGARAEEDMRVMDRPGTPADIAPVVAFLLSDGSAWIRGANIPVDGGMSSHLLSTLHGLRSHERGSSS
jgi:NAD(P)-dependent dehydrogenase (short-subunit alcohol dehydrogenase family)